MAKPGGNSYKGAVAGFVIGIIIAFAIGCSAGDKFVGIGIGIACTVIGGLIGCAFEKY